MADSISIAGGLNVAFRVAAGDASPLTSSITLTNMSSPAAHVVVKVKTSNAERFLVKPHIALLKPGEERTLTIVVQAAQRDAFVAEMQSSSHRRTAFLLLVWPLKSEVATQVAGVEAAKLNATLNAMWYAEEEHLRATRGAAFKSFKLTTSLVDAQRDEALNSSQPEARGAPAVSTPVKAAPAAAPPVLESVTPPMSSAPSTMTRTVAVEARSEPAAAPAAAVTASPPAAATIAAPSVPTVNIPESRRVVGVAQGVGRGADGDTPLPTAKLEEVIAIRQKYNDLQAQAVLLRGERDSLAKALAARENEVEEAQLQCAALQQALQEAQTGLRLRKPAAASAAAEAATPPTTDDDDEIVKEAPGFPLWQVMLVALIMFLIGYFVNVALAP